MRGRCLTKLVSSLGENDEEDNSSGSDMYGDFEDLENGEMHSGDAAVRAARKAIDDVADEERREKKRARKALFNEQVIIHSNPN